VGRPTLLTQDRYDEAVKWYKDGATHREVSDAISVGFSTLEGWLRTGEEEIQDNIESIYSSFTSEVKRARSFVAKKRRNKIESDESWQSAAWLLERTRPKEYGRNVEEIKQAKILEQQYKELKEALEQMIDTKSNCK